MTLAYRISDKSIFLETCFMCHFFMFVMALSPPQACLPSRRPSPVCHGAVPSTGLSAQLTSLSRLSWRCPLHRPVRPVDVPPSPVCHGAVLSTDLSTQLTSLSRPSWRCPLHRPVLPADVPLPSVMALSLPQACPPS